jgi:hypothetical protein
VLIIFEDLAQPRFLYGDRLVQIFPADAPTPVSLNAEESVQSPDRFPDG